MSKHYAILKLQKLNRKERREIQMRSNHVNREKNTTNVNPAKSELNRCIVGPENADWYFLFKERYDSLPYYKIPDSKKLRKDAVIGIEVVTSMSHDVAENINIEEWCNANTEWLKKHFGEANVLHGVLHMDEGTPHIHYFITPVLNGRFNSREFLGGKLDFVQRQTEYARAMEPFGLVRGSKGERLKYMDIQQLYNATSEDIEDLPLVKEGETAEEYRTRIFDLYIRAQLIEKKAYNEFKALSSIKDRNEEYQEIIDRLNNERSTLKDRLAKIKYDAANMTIRGLKVSNIIAAVEKHPDQNSVNMYLRDLAELDEVGAILLAEENLERKHD